MLGMIPVPLIILTMKAYDKFVRPAFRARQVKLGELNAALNDNISGVREIMTFTREDAESLRVNDYIIDYRDTNLHALRLMATFHPLVQFASSLGTIVLIYFGGKFVLGQTLAVADLVAFFLTWMFSISPFRNSAIFGKTWNRHWRVPTGKYSVRGSSQYRRKTGRGPAAS
jgi:ABC-type multidrug transport system fused ATPase/permease subunit